MQAELMEFPVHAVGAGSQFIVVASADVCIGWGKPIGGKLGLEVSQTYDAFFFRMLASTSGVETWKSIITLTIDFWFIIGRCRCIDDAEVRR